MKTKILLSVLVVAILIACKKDGFQSKPQLTLKKVSTTTLARNQGITFTIEATDAEGDIQDSMFIQKISKNCIQSNLSARYRMPQFAATKNLRADIEVNFGYNDIPPKCFPRNDTAVFRFWLKDKANNVSDTITTQQIVILQ